MRRFVLGVVLLGLVLGGCLWITRMMKTAHGPISDKLEEAAQLAMKGDWEQGTALGREAQQLWQERRELTAAVVDHAPMDEIDGLFAQMDSFAAGGCTVEFAGLCARLAQLVKAVAEANSFAWWSFL